MPKGNPHPNTKGLKPPWKPGCASPNPSGRPRQPLSDAYRWFLALPAWDVDIEKCKKDGFKLPEHATQAHVIAAGQGRIAIADARSAKEMREATEGKAKMRIELTGEEGGPIGVEDVDERLAQKLLKK